MTDSGCEGTEIWERDPTDRGQSKPKAHSDVVPLYAFRTPEDTMTTTTDHYLGIDLHKREAQVAVLDDEGEEVHVANVDLFEISQKHSSLAKTHTSVE
ncbi:hypothetical protein GBQ70_03700 [Halomicrobium sp. ZPS1]|uniref:Transposase n=1 Tax=Halomicrobium mukohataei TaxID=57705 RepID=A0A4D6KAB6_9EURY|nr:hypothetical protein E5139_03700 [Halomicrobium mukohataei]QFR19591.1 hypothetical protein GBQ70_03700 [Halomicrobium sp. ZPS1]